MDRYKVFPSGELGMSPTGNWTPYADAQATVEALQKKYDDLLGKYRQLVDFYDKHNGTPCEQIRHQQQVEALQRERDSILKAINDSTYTDRRGRRCMAFKQLEEVIGKIEGSGKGGPTGRVDALSECARCHGPMPVQTTGGSRKRYCSTTCKDSDRDPAKLASRLALKTAVNRGEIVRPASCQRCGKSEALIEGHHHDYAKPLDVQWLCPKCHAATHMEMRANGQNI